MPEPIEKPVVPVKYGPTYWAVGKGVIALQVSGKDVSNAHVSDLGHIQFTKKPGDGLKMVGVKLEKREVHSLHLLLFLGDGIWGGIESFPRSRWQELFQNHPSRMQREP